LVHFSFKNSGRLEVEGVGAEMHVSLEPSIDVVGFRVSSLTLEDNAALIARSALAGNGMWVLTLNLEMVARAATDPDYHALTGDADLIVADGMPIVWLSHLDRRHAPIRQRTCGADLTVHLLRHFEGRMGVLGGQAPRQALERLGIDPARIAFVEGGVVQPDNLAPIIARLNSTRCQLLFVALGVPKQDIVCKALRAACPDLVCIGVGGTFEALAGIVPRAPIWVREFGLEWLFRLVTEPMRLWRRYLLLYPRALPSIARWARAVTASNRAQLPPG
jgi:N-acetylglucosaminyldiphosphoundecaprenol N-acetyl-beta-D-mannosaminyltransferase